MAKNQKRTFLQWPLDIRFQRMCPFVFKTYVIDKSLNLTIVTVWFRGLLQNQHYWPIIGPLSKWETPSPVYREHVLIHFDFLRDKKSILKIWGFHRFLTFILSFKVHIFTKQSQNFQMLFVVMYYVPFVDITYCKKLFRINPPHGPPYVHIKELII